MADIKKININGTSYNIKDATKIDLPSSSVPSGYIPKSNGDGTVTWGIVENDDLYYAKEEVDILLDAKYTKPTTGIPASDIAEGVIPNISTKADLVDGKVPASQLPSYVDDVLEFASLANFPETGEEGKIYVTKDTNFTYRWSGTTYVKLTDVDLTNYYTKTETDTQMSGKANITHTHTKSQITDFEHNHDDRYYTETETNTLLSGKADIVHNHDDRYYTETETNTLLAGKQNTLTAGENITIENNVISASGGSGGVIVHLTEDGEGNISCDTSIATIKGYYDAEKLVYCQDANGIRLPLVMATSTVVSFAVGGADGSHDDVMNGLSYIGIISDTTDTWIFLQATLDGKMTEIYNSSTSKSKYTPSELKDMMESNTAMMYNGITILKSEMFNSKFYFYFLDNYNIEKYEVDASKNVTRVTQRVLVDDNELSGAISSHNSNNSAHSSLFNGKANVNHTHNGNDVSYSTGTYYYDGTVGKAISGKADAVHNHDDRYYTESEVDTKLGAKQDTLIAGTNITIENNVISASGGSGGVISYYHDNSVYDTVEVTSTRGLAHTITYRIRKLTTSNGHGIAIITGQLWNTLLMGDSIYTAIGENITPNTVPREIIGDMQIIGFFSNRPNVWVSNYDNGVGWQTGLAIIQGDAQSQSGYRDVQFSLLISLKDLS